METVYRGKELTKVVLEYEDGSKEELARCIVLEALQDEVRLIPFNVGGERFIELMFKVLAERMEK